MAYKLHPNGIRGPPMPERRSPILFSLALVFAALPHLAGVLLCALRGGAACGESWAPPRTSKNGVPPTPIGWGGAAEEPPAVPVAAVAGAFIDAKTRVTLAAYTLGRDGTATAE